MDLNTIEKEFINDLIEMHNKIGVDSYEEITFEQVFKKRQKFYYEIELKQEEPNLTLYIEDKEGLMKLKNRFIVLINLLNDLIEEKYLLANRSIKKYKLELSKEIVLEPSSVATGSKEKRDLCYRLFIRDFSSIIIFKEFVNEPLYVTQKLIEFVKRGFVIKDDSKFKKQQIAVWAGISVALLASLLGFWMNYLSLNC